MKIISCDLLRLRVRSFFLDHSSTFASSSNLVSTFRRDDDVGLSSYVSSSTYHRRICTASFLVWQQLSRWSLRHSWLDQCQSPELFQQRYFMNGWRWCTVSCALQMASSALHLSGSLNRVPASAGLRAGMSPLPGGRWHCVIPCGMWVPVAVWQPCELLYTCYLLTYLLTKVMGLGLG